jgi:hypothetical protein
MKPRESAQRAQQTLKRHLKYSRSSIHHKICADHCRYDQFFRASLSISVGRRRTGEGTVERDAEARKLLREPGFEVEDFPDYYL